MSSIDKINLTLARFVNSARSHYYINEPCEKDAPIPFLVHEDTYKILVEELGLVKELGEQFGISIEVSEEDKRLWNDNKEHLFILKRIE